MRICLISFDFWHYDEHIVYKLKEKGIDAFHINIGAFTHKNFGEKIANAFSKIFLGRNLKHEKRQRFVEESLGKFGHQDQILVLNPDIFDAETLQFIKQKTDRLITYLYDNLERFPVQDKLHFFDKIFSFDDKDVEEFGFEKLTNYNYLEPPTNEKQKPKLDLFYITSFDKTRNKIIAPLAKKLDELSVRFEIFVVGKKSWKPILKYFFMPHLKNVSVKFRRKIIPTAIINDYYKNSKVILDLMREGQFGLSFRVFEAMALEKKIITNNQTIKDYDFYNPNNILILDNNFNNLNKDFFEKPYQKLPEEIYDFYTLDKWVERVFNLK